MLAKELKVTAVASGIRRVLNLHGYRWLPRAQKPLHDAESRKERRRFAQTVVNMSKKDLRSKLQFAMDGVVLSIPPRDAVGRWNHVFGAEDHMWRKAGEAAQPELSGDAPYSHQVPLERAVPLWGGVSEGGFAIVFCHPRKKTNSIEWSRAVNGGKLAGAIRSVNKHRRRGPWQVLCDNESFLAKSAAAHERASVSLWRVPPKSPDLNPVEKYWSWLRRRLRSLDLKDVAAGRPVPGKTAYIQRVRAVCRSRQSQKVARACALGLRRVCQEVLRKKGARARS